jgi:hypothetical protein
MNDAPLQVLLTSQGVRRARLPGALASALLQSTGLTGVSDTE